MTVIMILCTNELHSAIYGGVTVVVFTYIFHLVKAGLGSGGKGVLWTEVVDESKNLEVRLTQLGITKVDAPCSQQFVEGVVTGITGSFGTLREQRIRLSFDVTFLAHTLKNELALLNCFGDVVLETIITLTG